LNLLIEKVSSTRQEIYTSPCREYIDIHHTTSSHPDIAKTLFDHVQR
jgi:hypothetical protein